MARDMVRGGSGNNLDNPTRQTGRVFFISRRNYDRAIQLEHPCYIAFSVGDNLNCWKSPMPG